MSVRSSLRYPPGTLRSPDAGGAQMLNFIPSDQRNSNPGTYWGRRSIETIGCPHLVSLGQSLMLSYSQQQSHSVEDFRSEIGIWSHFPLVLAVNALFFFFFFCLVLPSIAPLSLSQCDIPLFTYLSCFKASTVKFLPFFSVTKKKISSSLCIFVTTLLSIRRPFSKI